MRRVLVRLTVAAVCVVALELSGPFTNVALAQAPGMQPGGAPPTTDPGTTPPSTDPGTPPPATDPGTPPSGGTPPGGDEPGGPPAEPVADPVLAFLLAVFDAISEFVATEYPDAPPEFQAWLTMAVFDHFFGDMLFEYLFGVPADAGWGGGR